MDSLTPLTFPQLGDVAAALDAYDWLRVLLGVTLLTFGRKLFWLALAGLGFAVALLLADQYLQLADPRVEIALALAVGIAGAWLALVAQRIALALAGFLIGLWLAVLAAQSLWPDLGWEILVVGVLGGLLGSVVGRALFSVVLVLISIVAGIVLILGAIPLEPQAEPWVAMGLFAVGLVFQSGALRRRRKRRRERD